MKISNKSVSWQPSAALIVAIILKSLLSLLAFKLKPQSVILVSNHFYSSTVELVSVVSTMCIMYSV